MFPVVLVHQEGLLVVVVDLLLLLVVPGSHINTRLLIARLHVINPVHHAAVEVHLSLVLRLTAQKRMVLSCFIYGFLAVVATVAPLHTLSGHMEKGLVRIGIKNVIIHSANLRSDIQLGGAQCCTPDAAFVAFVAINEDNVPP